MVLEHLLSLFADIGQGAALDGLHHHYRNAMPGGNFIAAAGLNGGILPVQIVDLQLYKVHIRVLGEDLFQQISAVMEGEAHIHNLAVSLLLAQPVEGIQLLDSGPGTGIDIVQQEVIKELYTAVFQLFGKVLVHIRSFPQLDERQLGSQGEAVPGVTLDQCFPYSLFTGDTVVNIGGIKVGEPTLQEGIHHLFKLRHINGGDIARIEHRQPHAAKTKFFHEKNLLRITRFLTVFILQ